MAGRTCTRSRRTAARRSFSRQATSWWSTSLPVLIARISSIMRTRAREAMTSTGGTFSPSSSIARNRSRARPGGAARKPAVVFVHGGPPRQMLLGWHYMDYYTNSYAMNQYLASTGFVVLAVNYRLGIGYGHDFHHPAHAGALGASEYQDVKAGGLYLRS